MYHICIMLLGKEVTRRHDAILEAVCDLAKKVGYHAEKQQHEHGRHNITTLIPDTCLYPDPTDRLYPRDSPVCFKNTHVSSNNKRKRET